MPVDDTPKQWTLPPSHEQVLIGYIDAYKAATKEERREHLKNACKDLVKLPDYDKDTSDGMYKVRSGA